MNRFAFVLMQLIARGAARLRGRPFAQYAHGACLAAAAARGAQRRRVGSTIAVSPPAAPENAAGAALSVSFRSAVERAAPSVSPCIPRAPRRAVRSASAGARC